MILNKYLFQANKMVTKQNRLIVIGLVILRHTMSNLSLAFLYTPWKKKKKKKKKKQKNKKTDQKKGKKKKKKKKKTRKYKKADQWHGKSKQKILSEL